MECLSSISSILDSICFFNSSKEDNSSLVISLVSFSSSCSSWLVYCCSSTLSCSKLCSRSCLGDNSCCGIWFSNDFSMLVYYTLFCGEKKYFLIKYQYFHLSSFGVPLVKIQTKNLGIPCSCIFSIQKACIF